MRGIFMIMALLLTAWLLAPAMDSQSASFDDEAQAVFHHGGNRGPWGPHGGCGR